MIDLQKIMLSLPVLTFSLWSPIPSNLSMVELGFHLALKNAREPEDTNDVK